jgi:hypothetical protein
MSFRPSRTFAAFGRLRFTILIWLTAGLGFSVVSAKNLPAPIDSSNYKLIQFQQNFNTYQWEFTARHTWNFHPQFSFSLNHNFISSLLKLGLPANKWKDNQSLELKLKYLVKPNLALSTMFSSLDFSDQQTGVVNDLIVKEAKLGADYFQFFRQKTKILAASASGGLKTDRRYNINDQGLTYDFNVRWPDFDFSEYHNTLLVDLQSDHLGPRQQRDAVFYDQIFRQFYTETTDTLTLMFDQKRRDYYISYEGDIERFEEQNFLFNNKVRYHVTNAISFQAINEIKNRIVDVSQFDSTQTTTEARRRTDFRSDNKFSFEIKQERLKGRLAFNYWNQEQKYDSPAAADQLPFSRRLSFIAPDNKSYLVEIATQWGWWFTLRDSLAFGSTFSRLQYDTPDSSNFDDRDELRWEIKWCEVHIFSPRLKSQLEMTTGLYHLLYIFGERSADNNWNRIFRLKPQIWFSLFDNLLWNQSFEVLANYVDYDFELEPTDVRSFVYRKFAGDTNLNWRLFKTSAVGLGYRLELEENGKLYWERWAERPLLSRTNQWFRAHFSFSPRPFFHIVPGINFYTRNEWKYVSKNQGELIKEAYQKFQSYGPTLSIQYYPHEKLRFSGMIARNKITGNKKNNYYINNVSVNLNWNF